MATDKQKLLTDLKDLGIKEGDTVLVHASMKAIQTNLSPVTILTLLQKAAGRGGTILLPTLTYDTVTERNPYFDSERSMACTGILPRTFQMLPGVTRSVHPTHSVAARGALADVLTRTHFRDRTPVGIHSPFRKLPHYGGRILFIGDIVDRCTFMHGVEEMAHADYALCKRAIPYVVNGVERLYYPHDFSRVAAQRYDRIKTLPGVHMKTGALGKAPCFLFDAAEVQTAALEAMQRDPYYFVELREID